MGYLRLLRSDAVSPLAYEYSSLPLHSSKGTLWTYKAVLKASF